MYIVKHTKFFIIFSLFVAILAFISIFSFGLRSGIDFTGGSIIELTYPSQLPQQSELEEAVSRVIDGGYSIRPSGDNGYTIRTPFLEDAIRETLISEVTFSEDNIPNQDRISSIGPVMGDELTSKALIAIGIIVLLTIIFIAFSFRKVRGGEDEPKGLSSWYYGLAAIISLVFDTLVPTGAFALLGAFSYVEMDILFVTALLTILGYSINDTIVVFDRIRENLIETKHKVAFNDIVGRSLSETYMRSINNSLTTFLTLLMLYVIGGTTTQNFAFVLMGGVIAGSYSSIFLASPLLVAFNAWKEKK